MMNLSYTSQVLRVNFDFSNFHAPFFAGVCSQVSGGIGLERTFSLSPLSFPFLPPSPLSLPGSPNNFSSRAGMHLCPAVQETALRMNNQFVRSEARGVGWEVINDSLPGGVGGVGRHLIIISPRHGGGWVGF